MLPIIILVERLSQRSYRSPVSIKHGVLRRAVATVAEEGQLEGMGMSGESLWLRQVEEDELFEARDRWLLLQPRQIREIESEFVYGALQENLEHNGNEARLAVLLAAGQLLMEHLTEDLWLIPSRFPDVIAAIDEVLTKQTWFDLSEEKIRSLDSEVIKKVRIS